MEVLRARRCAFLHAVHAAHIDSSSGKELALQTIGKTRLVVAKADFTKGELVLAPLTMSIVAATSDKIPPLAVKFKHPRLTNRKDENLLIYAAKHAEVPQEAKADEATKKDAKKNERKPFLAPFWHIAASGDTDVANMKIVSSNVQDGISVPNMKNTRKITMGTEVVVFDPSLQVSDQASEAKDTSAAKRQRLQVSDQASEVKDTSAAKSQRQSKGSGSDAHVKA